MNSTEVLARLKPFGISFEKSLNDLIKGIRAKSKESPEALAAFLDSALSECRSELRQTDLETKAMAILKLAYLEMYGFDMSWANFQILEVMSSSKFQHKRIGYLAAIQSFKNEQDLLILATNQFKKDLNSHNHAEIGLALSGIATIVTPNLSKDINDDVLMKLNHSSAYIRKKAVLAMYKVFLQFPDSLRLNFSRIVDKLDDGNVAVVSATVNVICEISKKNPKLFITFLPKFFTILEETKNNWLIIRILKLFQQLSRVEPRMKKKIMPTLLELMRKTQASSLIYECINCIVQGSMLAPDSSRDKDVARVCVGQLMDFFSTKDSNLKFVGLLALINILKVYPALIASEPGVTSVIMECLTDPDAIIKGKALEICQYLVNEDNIVDIVKVLLVQLVPRGVSSAEGLRVAIARKIISIAQYDNYNNIPNFRWYVAVINDIIQLTLLPPADAAAAALSASATAQLAAELGKEVMSIATKVPSVRPTLLSRVVLPMVAEPRVFERCPRLLADLYWTVGEYCDEIAEEDDDDDDDDKIEPSGLGSSYGLSKKLTFFTNVVNPPSMFPVADAILTKLNAHPEALAILITALVKVFSSIVSDYARAYPVDDKGVSGKHYRELALYLFKLIRFLGHWERHPNYEVQERALSWLEFLKVSSDALAVDNSELERMDVLEMEQFKREHIQNEESDDDSSDEFSDSEDDDEDDEGGDDDEYQQLPSDNEEPANEWADSKKPSKDGTELDANPFDEPQQLPFLLTHVLPSFFKSYALNPVSSSAQRGIALPDDIDVDEPINPTPELLPETEGDDSYNFYAATETTQEPNLVDLDDEQSQLQRKQQRMERIRDDPFYIGGSTKKKAKEIIKDQSPDTGSVSAASVSSSAGDSTRPKKTRKLRKEKVVILSEETVGDALAPAEPVSEKKKKKKRNQLTIDSSNLDGFDLMSFTDPAPENPDENKTDDIDLEAIRQSLANASLDKPKKKKKKSSAKATVPVEPSAETPSADTASEAGTPVIEVKKPKKKKKKAVIT
ncbi:AP-3 complex subunit delta [Diutina catenulata]